MNLTRLKRLCSGNNKINQFLKRHPRSAGVLFTSFKTLLADLVIQYNVEKRQTINEIDWIRASAFYMYGFGYLGMFQFWLYNKFYFRLFPNVTVISTIKKVLMDSFITSPFLALPVFYLFQTTLNEINISYNSTSTNKFEKSNINRYGCIDYINNIYQTTKSIWKNNIVKDATATWCMWLPAHCITFGIMPIHLRLFFVGCVSFCWCCLLSGFRGDYDENKHNLLIDIDTNQIDHDNVDVVLQ